MIKQSRLNLNANLSVIELDTKIINKLNNNDIKDINDLWKTSRTNLKKMGFNDSELNQISIKMQLHGMDLNKKIYSRN